MSSIDVAQLNTDENAGRTLGTIKINGIVFKGVGYGMLKTANTVSMRDSVTRQTDFTITDINKYVRRAIPHVEIGFNWIDATDFIRLRQLLLRREELTVEYYDNDFGKYVTHKMYPNPDDLKTFEAFGQVVRGVKKFTVTLVGTMNDEPSFDVEADVDHIQTSLVWSPSSSFKGNQYVKSDNSLAPDIYRCEADNTGKPLSDTSYWTKIDLSFAINSVKWGEMYTVPDCTRVIEGKKFANKYVDKNGEEYYVGDSILIFENLALRAVYTNG